jgi:hypothetical protein
MGIGIPLLKRARKVSIDGRMQWRIVVAFAFAVLVLMAFVPTRAFAAVTISSFTAKPDAPHIEIDWTTATEINNAGFNLLRSTSQNGTFTQIAGLIPAKYPGSVIGASYSYTDGAVTAGQTYFYKLVSVESGGATQQFGPVSASVAVPATATPTATATSTPPPPTATVTPQLPTALPTETSLSTSTPIPPATATSLPTPTNQSLPNLTSTPIPTRVAKVARASSSPTPDVGIALDNQPSPTPGVTLVALGIKDTPVPEMGGTQTETNTPAQDSVHTRSYYLFRLLDATLLLTAGTLVFASFVLGAVSVYFFLRAYLR